MRHAYGAWTLGAASTQGGAKLAFRGLAFATALVILVGSIVGSHLIAAAIAGAGSARHSANGVTASPRSTPVVQPTATAPVVPVIVATRVAPMPTPATTKVRPTAPSTSAPTMPAYSGAETSVPGPAAQIAAVQLPVSTGATYAPPQPASFAGIRLVNYWVAHERVLCRQTLEIGYVIDNATGGTLRLWLGASIRPTRAGDWASGIINDPAKDVVASVPPGVTTHVRFFRLSAAVQPGDYDVAWGLRNALTGRRVVLVAATRVVKVVC